MASGLAALASRGGDARSGLAALLDVHGRALEGISSDCWSKCNGSCPAGHKCAAKGFCDESDDCKCKKCKPDTGFVLSQDVAGGIGRRV